MFGKSERMVCVNPIFALCVVFEPWRRCVGPRGFREHVFECVHVYIGFILMMHGCVHYFPMVVHPP